MEVTETQECYKTSGVDDFTLQVRDYICKTCSELQSVKDQLCDELIRFKEKAEELEVKVEEVSHVCESHVSRRSMLRWTLDNSSAVYRSILH